MSASSGSSLREQAPPILSARLTELAQYMSAPLLGRLTDEQRSLCLAIARRLVTSVAERIDPAIPVHQLWSDWLTQGVPINDEWSAACFARAEEHRWRALSEAQHIAAASPPVSYAAARSERHEQESSAVLIWPNADVAKSYRQLQMADRRRFASFGYPSLAIADISEDLYRHLLNEIARWRLNEVSRDRRSSVGLGDAVRHAWTLKSDAQALDQSARAFFNQLIAAGHLHEEANAAILRHDWPSFIGLSAVARGCRYAEMAIYLVTATSDELSATLASLRLRDQTFAVLEASLSTLPARAMMADFVR